MASTKYSASKSWDEPTLAELLADPIIQLIMQRDGVKPADMQGEIDRVRSVYLDVALA